MRNSFSFFLSLSSCLMRVDFIHSVVSSFDHYTHTHTHTHTGCTVCCRGIKLVFYASLKRNVVVCCCVIIIIWPLLSLSLSLSLALVVNRQQTKTTTLTKTTLSETVNDDCRLRRLLIRSCLCFSWRLWVQCWWRLFVVLSRVAFFSSSPSSSFQSKSFSKYFNGRVAVQRSLVFFSPCVCVCVWPYARTHSINTHTQTEGKKMLMKRGRMKEGRKEGKTKVNGEERM